MKTVLIANRGEIACRIARSCRELGLRVGAVYSDADVGARHVLEADVAVRIGPPPARESYLNQDAILDAAVGIGATAIHPGYGFLAENAGFAARVEEAGLIFVGPRADSIELMGDKEQARQAAADAGVPVLPGSSRFVPGTVAEKVVEMANAVGFPLLVKASAGGGGIGMRHVETPQALEEVVVATSRVAERAFGDGTVYLERYVALARHVEVQVFGFGDGRVVHLYERDCSLQRRFQKVVEESPAPLLPDDVRQHLCDSAVALSERINYRGAGTVEFIVDLESMKYYFLEMNTRIQVEHPVTECVTGVDLVGLQLHLALGQAPQLSQEHIQINGHAVEARLYAEDPTQAFRPSPGRIDQIAFPFDPNIRIECAVQEGSDITPYYDPLIAKIIAWAPTRPAALDQLAAALAETQIDGIATNRQFLIRLLQHSRTRAGDVSVRMIDDEIDVLTSG